MKSPAIEVTNLAFSYEKKGPRVINNISLNLPEGKITTLLGPNGAGKTTFIHLILGIIPVLDGNIAIRGQTVDLPNHSNLSRLIGLVPQAEKSPLNFTVLEYVLLGRSPYINSFKMPSKSDIEKAMKIIKELRLDHLAHRVVPSLSGGEHQMVMIARALVQDTPILLLDEPTAHLDLNNKHRILSILKNLAKQGKTVIFTTHDPNEAAYAADYLVLIKSGSLQQAGEIQDVLTKESLMKLYDVEVSVETINQQKVVILA